MVSTIACGTAALANGAKTSRTTYLLTRNNVVDGYISLNHTGDCPFFNIKKATYAPNAKVLDENLLGHEEEGIYYRLDVNASIVMRGSF